MTTNHIKNIKPLTNQKHLNMYELEACRRDGSIFPYYMSSRHETVDEIKNAQVSNKPDAVVIAATMDDKLVLIKELRYPVNNYIYELPAGLVDQNEDCIVAGIREMFEETGLHFTPTEDINKRMFYTSPGMTDETCTLLFGTCTGSPSNQHQSESEDIEVILADKDECARLLREEPMGVKCAYAIMLFLEHK